MVPADEVEQLVAGRELDLTQPLVRLDTRRQLDLVAVGIEPAASARVRPDDPAMPAERPHVVRETAQGAFDQDLSRCYVEVQLPAPEGASKVRPRAAPAAPD